MGTNVRLLWDHIGLAYTLQASGENAAFPASNLLGANIRRFWKGTGPTEHTLMYDSGSGNTVQLDTVVLPFASMLVAIGASVALQRSDDASAWTDVWTKTPLTSGDLAKPDLYHFIREESATLTRRAFRIRIYGSLGDAPALGGSLFLGIRTELPLQPAYGRVLGSPRAYRGRDIALGFTIMSPAQAESIANLVASVTPNADELPVETVSGAAYGGLPHWMYDPVGTVLCREAVAAPYLFPVLCSSPEAAQTRALTTSLEETPEIHWRERR